MKLSELIKQSVSLITENDILKDIVFADDTVESVIDKIKDKEAQDILVVYVSPDKKVLGVVTDTNVSTFLDNVIKLDKPLSAIKVSELSWDSRKEVWIKKENSITSFLEKLTEMPENIFIVVDKNDIYAGKIKRKNALVRIRSLTE